MKKVIALLISMGSLHLCMAQSDTNSVLFAPPVINKDTLPAKKIKRSPNTKDDVAPAGNGFKYSHPIQKDTATTVHAKPIADKKSASKKATD